MGQKSGHSFPRFSDLGLSVTRHSPGLSWGYCPLKAQTGDHMLQAYSHHYWQISSPHYLLSDNIDSLPRGPFQKLYHNVLTGFQSKGSKRKNVKEDTQNGCHGLCVP